MVVYGQRRVGGGFFIYIYIYTYVWGWMEGMVNQVGVGGLRWVGGIVVYM